MEINPYAKAISSVLPGTFVPDIGNAAPKSEPLGTEGAAAATSFKDTVSNLLNDVNSKEVEAQQKSVALATGASNDTAATIKSVEEAGLAMQMTLAVRNKVMAAYQELQQMQM